MQGASRDGIGTMKRRAGVISLDDEDILWKTGTIGIDTPVKLLRAIFYYIKWDKLCRPRRRGTAQLEVGSTDMMEPTFRRRG